MGTQKLNSFHVLGISVRTTNENGQAVKDISELWGKFMSEGILDKIPNKIGTEIYSIYTDYEKDHTKPYTTILACKVENLDKIPEGMVAKTIEEANYEVFVAKGNLMQDAVINEWVKIWNSNIDRSYTCDFEVYGSKSRNMENGEIEIFIALN